MATVTIQHLVAHSNLLDQYIALFKSLGPVLTPVQTVAFQQLTDEATKLQAGLKDFFLQSGAGLFPNTFQRGGLYTQCTTPKQETALLLAGWAPATFPQTMTKSGFPDLVVHNGIQKDEALDAGYILPLV